MKLIRAIGTCFFCAAFYCGFSVNAKESESITIVMSGSYPPWNNTSSSGEHIGFEPEMIKEMCARMNRKCEIKTIFWKRLISSVRFGKYDVGISGIAINKYLKKMIISSTPYGKKGAVFVTKKKTPLHQLFCENELRAICGKDFDISSLSDQQTSQLEKMSDFLTNDSVTLAVEGGSGREWLLENLLPKTKAKKLSGANALLEILKSGEINTVMVGRETWLARAKQPAFQDFEQVGPVFYGGNLGSDVTAITHPDHAEFIKLMDVVIADMRADGTMSRLSKKWFGRDITQ